MNNNIPTREEVVQAYKKMHEKGIDWGDSDTEEGKRAYELYEKFSVIDEDVSDNERIQRMIEIGTVQIDAGYTDEDTIYGVIEPLEAELENQKENGNSSAVKVLEETITELEAKVSE